MTDTQSPLTRAGMQVGDLALIDSQSTALPPHSLVRIVADETDGIPAVDVLIPTAPLDDAAVAPVRLELLAERQREVNRGVCMDLDPGRTYYWCSLRHLIPINTVRQPLVVAETGAFEGLPYYDPKETDHD